MERRRRAADGEDGVGDLPWAAARAARGADAEPGEIEENGERRSGLGNRTWAKCFMLCGIGAGALKPIVGGMIQIRSTVGWR